MKKINKNKLNKKKSIVKKIVPSIIATTQSELEERIKKVNDFSDTIQLDIMDGEFAPKKVLDFNFKLPKNKFHVEAHLMVKDPEEWVKKKSKIADTIIFHIESTKKPMALIRKIKNKGKKAGLALKPGTKVHEINKFLPFIDQILIFTADKIGYYGASFSEISIDKVNIVRKIAPDLDIEVDGGVSPITIRKLADAGANLFVVGSYLQKSEDVNKAMNILKDAIY